jgi:hypothetical protein
MPKTEAGRRWALAFAAGLAVLCLGAFLTFRGSATLHYFWALGFFVGGTLIVIVALMVAVSVWVALWFRSNELADAKNTAVEK